MSVFASLVFSIIILYNKGCLAISMKGCTSSDPFDVTAISETKGDIYSPGFQENQTYPNHLYCLYTIRTAPGKRIKLTFKHMDIDPFDMCGKDMLSIHDGPNRDGPLLGIFCGTEAPYPILSSQNAIHLFFYTNFLTGRRGFHIEYEVTSSTKICPEGYEMCRNRNCYRVAAKCNGDDDCGDGTDEENCGFPLTTTECGVQNIIPYNFSAPDRIVGGMGARQGSWPWQVDMQINYYHPNGHTCGGTLINSQWAMTALHCLKGNGLPESWRVHIGNHHKFEKDPHEQVRYVERFVIYPGHTGQDIIGKPIDIVHDIALVKLNAPVEFSDYVKPACLPPEGHDVALGTQCVATGWGTTRGTGSNTILKQVQLGIRDNKDCAGSYQPTMICTRTDKGLQDSCHGDSGGPLECKIGSKWHVVGIASYVTGSNILSGACAMPGTGSVYNKVSAKTKWIQEMIQRFN